MRERTRERGDQGPKPGDRTFQIGDKVRYFDEKAKHWKNFGMVSDIQTHGATKV